jgi:uncharacterized membrane-anchored protein YitT (DUF2179 family)
VALNGILIPRQFAAGGVTGVALIIHYIFPDLPIGGVYFLINIPLFILGWINVGRRFFVYSLAGLIFFTAAVTWIHVPISLDDKILAALFAAIVAGIGGGLIFRSYGSAGGTDILCIFLLTRFSISIGSTLLAFNFVILMFSGFFFSLEMALYSLVFMYVYSKIVNLMVTGFSQRKAVMIISSKYQEITKEIINSLFRGVTIVDAHGGYSGGPIKVLYTVIALQELGRLKRTIRSIDPNAFVVVTDTLEVMGVRIGNQPHW